MDHQFSWELCKFLMFGAISDRENKFLINQSQVHLNRPKTQLQNVGMRYSLGNIYFGKARNGTVLKNGNDGIHQSDIQFCSQQQPSTPIISDKISG